MTCRRHVPRPRTQVLIAGVLALGWILFRSGSKPSRITYPCQRAAISAAELAFGASIVAGLLAVQRTLRGRSRLLLWTAIAFTGLLLTSGTWVYFSRADAPFPRADSTFSLTTSSRADTDGAPDASSLSGRPSRDLAASNIDPPRDYRAQLFHVSACPEEPAGDRFVGVDNLIATMGRGGLPFYRSPQTSLTAGPDGIIAADDVVLIKINYQWDQRGGTNVDLLRGLVRRVVDHPDGFTGEVVICENAQFNSTSGFDRPLNNAQVQSLSPHDMVVAFQAQGYDVSHFDWTTLRYTSTTEYAEGNLNDGYVVGPYDATLHGRVSYPKFRTPSGTYVSLANGIWNPGSGTYDRSQLRFLNVPVLKSHHAVYGATASVKHYMGLVTRELSTNSHSAIGYGILGAVLGEIGLADLNIMDAIWINADPNTGPGTNYGGATRRDELVASRDPVALDIWSVKNILVPGFYQNGYTPPWPTPSADPDLPNSAFRQYLDRSMAQMLTAGYSVTNDVTKIDVLEGSGNFGDFDDDGDVDASDHGQFAACFTGEEGGPIGSECAAADFDGDGDVDCDDWDGFRFVWTASGTPPDLAACDVTHVPESAPRTFRAWPAVPNPTPAGASITYQIVAPAPVTLHIFDVGGRSIRTIDATAPGAGTFDVAWDGRDGNARPVTPGVYYYRISALSSVATGSITIE